MTPKQLEVLRYVEDFTQRNSYSPTLQEVADHLKITKVTVLSHLRQLEKARADHHIFRNTPTTTPWMSTRSTMIGAIVALAGWSRIRPFSR